jgi:dGTPase
LKREDAGESILGGLKDAEVSDIRGHAIEDILTKLFSVDACERKHAISLLVGHFIMSIDVRRQEQFENPLLDLNAFVPTETRKLLDHFAKKITFQGIVKRREVQTLEYKGEKIIRELFDAFSERPLSLIGAEGLDPFQVGCADILVNMLNDPKKREADWRELDDAEQRRIARGICDFIAGMTNPYAEKYHRRLFEPGYGSSTDEL